MTKILITTGPEACGKTTLAQALSVAYQAPLVPEAARTYLDQQFANTGSHNYQQTDLTRIAQQQNQLEQQALSSQPPYLSCDTDLLVVIIWSEVKFGSVDPVILDLFHRSLATTERYYLLCDHQIPWQPDPQREDQHTRPALFARYQQALDHYQLNYRIVAGGVDKRVLLAQSLLNPPTGCPCCAD